MEKIFKAGYDLPEGWWSHEQYSYLWSLRLICNNKIECEILLNPKEDNRDFELKKQSYPMNKIVISGKIYHKPSG